MIETVTTSAPTASAQGQSSNASQGNSAPTSSGGQGGGANSFEARGNGTAQGQAAEAETGQANREQAAPAKRYLENDHDEALVKVKIDGVEQELSVKELKRLSSLERASQKRMSEAARLQKQVQQMQESWKQDPANALKALGKDPDSWAEELLARKYELAQMDPIQRENLELKTRIEAQQRMELESKRGVIDEIKKLSDKVPENLEKYSKEDLAGYRDHLVSVNEQAQSALQQEFIAAWDETGLPKHKTWGSWMAMEMMAHEKRTGQPLQAKEAAAKVKADYQKFNAQLLGQMDAQAIHDWLGKDVVKKLMDLKIQGVTDKAAQGFQRQAPQAAASDPKKPYMTEAEYSAWLKQSVR